MFPRRAELGELLRGGRYPMDRALGVDPSRASVGDGLARHKGIRRFRWCLSINFMGQSTIRAINPRIHLPTGSLPGFRTTRSSRGRKKFGEKQLQQRRGFPRIPIKLAFIIPSRLPTLSGRKESESSNAGPRLTQIHLSPRNACLYNRRPR